MHSLFALWTFAGIITALMIPSSPPNDQSKAQPDLHIATRGASIPTTENFTGTYLRNAAILAPPRCNSHIATFSFPQTSTYNITQCRSACDRISATKNAKKCRFFNMYTLFVNGTNVGMQCAMFDRRWNNSFATNNGSLDAMGRTKKGGDVFEVSNSFAYYLTDDSGEVGCGNEHRALDMPYWKPAAHASSKGHSVRAGLGDGVTTRIGITKSTATVKVTSGKTIGPVAYGTGHATPAVSTTMTTFTTRKSEAAKSVASTGSGMVSPSSNLFRRVNRPLE